MTHSPHVWQQELSIDPPGTWLVGVRGRLDQQLNPDLESTLNQLLEAGHSYLIVNLADATYINSGGLRVLVSAWRRARRQQGNVVLCGLNARLQEIFTMVGFDKVFKIYPSQQDAEQAATHTVS